MALRIRKIVPGKIVGGRFIPSRKGTIRNPIQTDKRNPYFNIGGQTIKAKTMRAALKKALRSQNRRRNVAAGYMDEEGRFHPIRASFDYSGKRAHEGKKRTTKRRRTR